MPGDPAGGRLGWRLPFTLRDATILACLVLSLTIAAVAFTGYQDHKAYTDYCKAAAHEGEQGCKAEKPFGESVFADPVVFFACVTALFTGCLIVVGVVQAGLFWWQLGLIREGLSDTQEAADAAKEQANLARQSLIASNRAWIKVDINPSGKPPIYNEAGLVCTLKFNMENVGNSVALAVTTNHFAFRGIAYDIQTDFLDKCEHLREQHNIVGMSLFPGEFFEYEVTLSASPDVVKASTLSVGGEDRAIINIASCVTYTFPADDKRKHQTRLLCEPIYEFLPIPVRQGPWDGNLLNFKASLHNAGQHAD